MTSGIRENNKILFVRHMC